MKLQPLLSEYFYENENLQLAGIGHLSIQHKAAQITTDDTSLLAPISELVFQQNENESIDENLVQFISERLQVSVEQAIILLEQEGTLQVAIAKEDAFEWPALGTFKRGEDGELFFHQECVLQQYLPNLALVPVPLHKEEQKEETVVATNVEQAQEIAIEPIEDLAEPGQQSRWWIAATIIFVVSVILILIRYFIMV